MSYEDDGDELRCSRPFAITITTTIRFCDYETPSRVRYPSMVMRDDGMSLGYGSHHA
jgi:hypothetical protein